MQPIFTRARHMNVLVRLSGKQMLNKAAHTILAAIFVTKDEAFL